MNKQNLIIIAIVILIFWAAFPFIIHHYLPDENNTWGNSGTFGDTYGALNALFSGATILGLLFTIYLQLDQIKMQAHQNEMQDNALKMQREELKLQRQELALQRDEMAATRNEFVMNRATNIVYSQLERVNHANQEFIFRSGDGASYKSEKGFEKLLETLLDEANHIGILNHIKISNDSIRKYITTLYNSTLVLKGIFLSNDLKIEEINELKTIYFLNVGNMQVNLIRRINARLLLSQQHLASNPDYYISIGVNQNYFLNTQKLTQSIQELRDTVFTTVNIDEHKVTWSDELKSYN